MQERSVSPPVPSARVGVGPFPVDDLTLSELTDRVAALVRGRAGADPNLVFALHVGSLLHRSDPEFLAAVRSASVVYADGIAIVALARLAGARHVVRAPTTDLGWAFLRRAAEVLGRDARVFLVGGSPGLAEAAGRALEAGAAVRVVGTAHGFHESWAPVLADIAAAQPDVVIVGLGMPREALWCRDHGADLPPALVLTCGGWFGFLAGKERRAPEWAQRRGIEWVFRLRQSPRRLFRRYALGLGHVLLLVPSALRRRRTGRAA